jgi:hypothetical protein
MRMSGHASLLGPSLTVRRKSDIENERLPPDIIDVSIRDSVKVLRSRAAG